MDWLELACKHLSVKPERVITSKEYEDKIVLVVDNGIAGCPKYSLSYSELTPYLEDNIAEVPEWEKELRAHYDGFKDRELVDAAKKIGVKNYWNMKRETLINRLVENSSLKQTELIVEPED